LASAPVYTETGLAADDAALVAAALQRMLAAHEPYPAVVMDRHWNILDRNHAAHALFGWLLRERARGPRQPGPPLLRARRPACLRRQLGGGCRGAADAVSAGRAA
jgi:PAS domain-containing protein